MRALPGPPPTQVLLLWHSAGQRWSYRCRQLCPVHSCAACLRWLGQNRTTSLPGGRSQQPGPAPQVTSNTAQAQPSGTASGVWFLTYSLWKESRVGEEPRPGLPGTQVEHAWAWQSCEALTHRHGCFRHLVPGLSRWTFSGTGLTATVTMLANLTCYLILIKA